MSFRINLVEDEQSLREILESYLKRENYIVKSFSQGKSALNSIGEEVDLWILDIMLPDFDGFEILREIKKQEKEIPVIFISARDRDIDRIVGLEMGADDYLAKPFLPRELVIRVDKLLKRIYKDRENRSEISRCLDLGDYLVNIESRQVHFKENLLELTTKEFDILLFFAENLGQAFSRQQLIDKIWGEQYYTSDRVVDDLIRRLRNKMKDIPLESIYGFGYRMNKK